MFSSVRLPARGIHQASQPWAVAQCQSYSWLIAAITRTELHAGIRQTESMAASEIERIASAILDLRGQRVILDRDLAALYGVTTARLNEAVKRNAARFPEDFTFRLTHNEHATLMSQIATSKIGRGGTRKPPRAFTEHGAIQAANVLNSPRAVEMGVHVVRVFARLRSNGASRTTSPSQETDAACNTHSSPPAHSPRTTCPTRASRDRCARSAADARSSARWTPA